MKSDISALLDDELEPGQAGRTIDALRRDRELREAWHIYHLIGDAMRRSPYCGVDLAEKVMARLEQEPVLLAPAALPRRSPARLALPIAAAVMGMAAVGWVALSLNAPQPAEVAVRPDLTKAQVPAAETTPSGALKEYLVAHQAHSPSGGIQGVAPYVRTVSEIRQGGRP